MRFSCAVCLRAALVIVAALGVLRAGIGWSQSSELAILNGRVNELYAAHKYQEALPLAKKAAELHVDLIPLHATALFNLARIDQELNNLDDAERLFKEALSARLAALGEGHHDTAESRNELALFYRNSLGRFLEAESLLKYQLKVYESAPAKDVHDEIFTLDILTGLYRAKMGKLDEAEALSNRALELRKREFGADHPETALNLATLALIYRDRGRYTEAEPLLKNALAIYEKSLAADDERIIEVLNILAGLYRGLQGRYGEAEPLLVRAVTILGAKDPDIRTAESLSNLALLYRDQRRYGKAEPLLQRALMIKEKSLGPDNLALVEILDALAVLYGSQGLYKEAEPYLRRALAIREGRLGAAHSDVGESMANLGMNYAAMGASVEAERLLRRALDIREKALGEGHPGVAQSLATLAAFLAKAGRHAEAEPLLLRSIAIREKTLGADHPTTAESYHNLGSLYADLHDDSRAMDYYEKSIDVLRRRRGVEVQSSNIVTRRLVVAGITRHRERFIDYIRVANRLSAKIPELERELRAKAYEAAQWAQLTDAAGALSQMSARFGSGNDALGNLVRDHQDLTNEWWVRDSELAKVLAKPIAMRVDFSERSIRARLDEIESRLAVVTRELQEKFPEYQVLSNPTPVPLAEAQDLLGEDEALFQVVANLNEGFVWTLTRREVRWRRVDLGATAIAREVSALRCGLDSTLWDDAESVKTCADMVGATPRSESVSIGGEVEQVRVLPFDLRRAHELYKVLLGHAEDMIKGKRLLVVPSGPLASLPFNVLVTEAPKAAIPEKLDRYRDALWLGAHTAITVLPSVASLKALRRFAKAGHSSKLYLGIGNPLLDGPQDDPVWGARQKERAALARTKSCAPGSSSHQIALARGPWSARGFASQLRGVRADIEQIRACPPLPETADELCEVGRRLGAPASDILLGADATETRLMELSAQGRLAAYAILHFATHGVLAGELKGSVEPGLILTPPPVGTTDPQALERDDGFLTASEIATLRLDAQWVVLSACNTAGAQSEGDEALSGIARAFFYAGARTLLVSHWEVASDASVKLITHTFALLKTHSEIGRAEAFMLSMRALVEGGNLAEAHPSIWAPFVIVGEGAESR